MKKSELHRELARAFERGDSERIKHLVELGADLNASGKWSGDATLLWLAVGSAGQEISKDFRDVASFLADQLPQVSPRDHAAKRKQSLEVIRRLIEAGADINLRSNGSTPLRGAVHWNDLEVVQLLLESGANPNSESFSIFSKLTTGKGFKTVPGYYNTVLHEAVEKNRLPIAKVLLAAGANPNRTDHEGKTPLAIAQEKGLMELVKLLEEKTTQPTSQVE